ncbi:MAG: glycosyltransferase [Paludibacteraceae bacterium]|nr:glycosyltransferase [Paludibacteraceae bacterium]
MPAVSVIVPIYNAERYLAQCIDSLLAQTYTDIELLLIDDGSKDHSGILCDQYAQQDPRVRVFHLTNGGVSKARNHGLSQATGTYVTFADADDWMEPDTIQTYISHFENDVDVVRIGYVREGRKRKTVSTAPHTTDKRSDYFLLTEVSRYHAFVWNTMYKRDLIGEQRFDESISYCEDHLFSYAYYLKCRKFRTLPTALYHYRVQDNNTLSDVKDAKVCFRIAELDYTAKNKLNNDGNKALGKRINEVYHRSIRKAIRTLYKSPNYNYEDRKRVWSAFTPATTDGMLFVERIFAAKKHFCIIDTYFKLIY